jgi:hypothetical protein
MVGWCIALGPVARQHNMAENTWWNKVIHLIVAGK